MKQRLLLFLVTVAVLLAPLFFVSRVNAAMAIDVTTPSNGTQITGSTFTIGGTASANRTISIYVNDSLIGTTTSDGSGNWSYTATNQSVGAKQVRAVVTGDAFAYVANSSSGNIAVINSATDTVTTTITASGAFLTLVNPAGTAVYVTRTSANLVTVINPSTNTITGSISVDSPFYLDLSDDGSKLYVSNQNTDTVTVINTATNTVSATINVGDFPQGLATIPGKNKVYVVNQGNDNVSVISTLTDTVLGTISVGDVPNGVAPTPSGSKAYVGNTGAGGVGTTVSAINTTTDAVTSTITVGSGPSGMSVSPTANKLYVGNIISGTMSVINTTTDTVSTTIAGAGGVLGVSFSRDGSKVYAGQFFAVSLRMFNPSNDTTTGTIAVGGSNPTAQGKAFGPNETASETIGLTLLSSTDSLASTGYNSLFVLIASVGLTVTGLGIAIFRRTYFGKIKV